MDGSRRALARRLGAGGLAKVALLAGLVAAPVCTRGAVQVNVGPESILMQGRYDKPASFPHRRHQEWYGCSACHHVEGQTMTIDKCQACHNDDVKGGNLESVRKAAHGQCKECHSSERAKGRTAAPVQCHGCHPAG